MNEKLRKIRETTGIVDGACLFNEDDIEEEFDPYEYDRKIKEAFNADYYDANDVDLEFGSDSDEDGSDLEKLDFEKEDELLGLPKGWDDVCGPRDRFLTAKERNLKQRRANKGQHEQVEEEEEIVPGEGKQMKKRKLSSLVKEGERMEGARIKTYQQQLRNKLLLEGEKLNSQKTGKKTSRTDNQKSNTVVGATENGKTQMEDSNGDTSKLSRRSRRRHRQADLKLSHSKLMAYVKILSKHKSKKKH
ncbi:hypothetical protein F0562_015589 [Nyssa sinensis]|uniref:Kri1-like C-terminal domain-containing protein n=1 Tax=Nyssa sinensis TaxID=561372 RepID=A0A5J4ZHT4_9ASTE|nr:hypothetical protein F0562_015589 [Nyssa sinensis]